MRAQKEVLDPIERYQQTVEAVRRQAYALCRSSEVSNFSTIVRALVRALNRCWEAESDATKLQKARDAVIRAAKIHSRNMFGSDVRIKRAVARLEKLEGK